MMTVNEFNEKYEKFELIELNEDDAYYDEYKYRLYEEISLGRIRCVACFDTVDEAEDYVNYMTEMRKKEIDW